MIEEIDEIESGEAGEVAGEVQDGMAEEAQDEVLPAARESKYSKLIDDTSMNRQKLTGMYMDWFLDYASYVILERAVPYMDDGLKPVQRRILHVMKKMDDGRYNKVANIVGSTMMYHPHGDASIGEPTRRRRRRCPSRRQGPRTGQRLVASTLRHIPLWMP